MKKISKRSGSYSRIEKEAARYVFSPETGSQLVSEVVKNTKKLEWHGSDWGPKPSIFQRLSDLATRIRGGAAGSTILRGLAASRAVLAAPAVKIVAILAVVGYAAAWAQRRWNQNYDLLNRMGITEQDAPLQAWEKWKESLKNSDLRTITAAGVSFPLEHPDAESFVSSFDDSFFKGEKLNAGHFLFKMRELGVISRTPKEEGFLDELGRAADFYNYSNEIERFVNTYNALAGIISATDEFIRLQGDYEKSQGDAASAVREHEQGVTAYFNGLVSELANTIIYNAKSKNDLRVALEWANGTWKDKVVSAESIKELIPSYPYVIRNNLKDQLELHSIEGWKASGDDYVKHPEFYKAFELIVDEPLDLYRSKVKSALDNWSQRPVPTVSSTSGQTLGAPDTSEGGSQAISSRDTDKEEKAQTYAPDPIYNYAYDGVVEQIQDFLINTANITTGEDISGRERELIRDGRYGPITQSALKKAVNIIDPSNSIASTQGWDSFIADKNNVLDYLQRNKSKFATDVGERVEVEEREATPEVSSDTESEVPPISAPSRPRREDSITETEEGIRDSEVEEGVVDGVETILDHVFNDRLKFEMFTALDLGTFGLALNEERRIKMFIQAFEGNTRQAAEMLTRKYTTIDKEVANFADKTVQEIKNMTDEKSSILSIFKPINQIYIEACGNRYRRFSVGVPRIKSYLRLSSNALTEALSALGSTGTKNNFDKIVKSAVRARMNKAKIKLGLV